MVNYTQIPDLKSESFYTFKKSDHLYIKALEPIVQGIEYE
jgi:hypothetical protein